MYRLLADVWKRNAIFTGVGTEVITRHLRPVVVNPTAPRASIYKFSERKNCLTIERAEKLVYIH